MVFCFVQENLFGTTQELEYLFFCRAKRAIFGVFSIKCFKFYLYLPITLFFC
jgi:hypothetical protein